MGEVVQSSGVSCVRQEQPERLNGELYDGR